jgi:hypothetical protein
VPIRVIVALGQRRLSGRSVRGRNRGGLGNARRLNSERSREARE